MESTSKTYTVNRLARLAGVSVRTLHHYDEIGLLSPSGRTEAGYRLYREQDLLRLQQILFFKELDVPLAEIGAILGRPGFDQVEALRQHRRLLEERAERLFRLLGTIDKTIRGLTEENMPLTDDELYEGFSKETRERWQREAREQYDPKLVEESNRRARSMSKAQWQAVKQDGDEVTRALAGLMDRQPGDAEVQKWIGRHHAWVANFWTPDAAAYTGLGQLYAENPEFRATYDNYRPGLADFMREAMKYYAEHELTGR